MTLTRPQLDVPPVTGWTQWYREFANHERERRNKQRADTGHESGAHILFDGPTQSGKTLLARYIARLRSFVVVFGTKAIDPSLDDYLNEGYTRIKQWPPTNKEWKDGGWGPKEARFILWPEIKDPKDLRSAKHRDQYAKCLQDAFINGGWTVVIDEGLWLCQRDGLNLGGQLSSLAYGGASAGASMYVLLQRPAGVPRTVWQSCADVMQFHAGVTNDVRELASLGTYNPKAVGNAIQGLQGHSFLHLPCRGGATWNVSEVEV